jgi:hypothetical protein
MQDKKHCNNFLMEESEFAAGVHWELVGPQVLLVPWALGSCSLLSPDELRMFSLLCLNSMTGREQSI